MSFNPNYFNILCIAWGSLALLYAVVIFMLGERSSVWVLKTFVPEKRPVWLVILMVLYLLLVAYTWYAVTTMNIEKSWIIALLFSCGVFKPYMVIFNYKGFRDLAVGILGKPSTLALLNVLIVIFSALLVFLGVFYYR